jgi:hypothetical protein
MQLTTDEFMVLLSTIVALPVVAVLTFVYLRGGFRAAEAARFAPLDGSDVDYWDTPDPVTPARRPAHGTGGGAR